MPLKNTVRYREPASARQCRMPKAETSVLVAQRGRRIWGIFVHELTDLGVKRAKGHDGDSLFQAVQCLFVRVVPFLFVRLFARLLSSFVLLSLGLLVCSFLRWLVRLLFFSSGAGRGGGRRRFVSLSLHQSLDGYSVRRMPCMFLTASSVVSSPGAPANWHGTEIRALKIPPRLLS